jgi:hypothetical protein
MSDIMPAGTEPPRHDRLSGEGAGRLGFAGRIGVDQLAGAEYLPRQQPACPSGIRQNRCHQIESATSRPNDS